MFKPLYKWLLLVGCLWMPTVEASTVVFLSPGYPMESFWSNYSTFMQAAARDLGMTLQVRFGNRDPQLTLSQAREALLGPNKPDYLIFVNELSMAPEILRLSQGTGVKLFAVNNTLNADQSKLLGDVRNRFPNFIGSLVSNDEEGGYLMAKELIRQHGPVPVGQSIEMVAFTGAKATPAARRREVGLYRALAEHPEVRLRQLVQGDWQRQRAQEQGRVLFKRYPQVRLVWSANDEMVFGAMAALREAGGEPGKGVLFGAFNCSNPAMHALLNGSLSALVGGHFTLGGWAMVMLHDYDALQQPDRHYLGARQVDVLQMISRHDAERLLQASRDDNYGLDFKSFSLEGKASPTAYRFSLKAILP
ncbi:MAG: periplasmic binding protein/LacI transcriptional regulator [Pseudomonas sp.]|nr:periplasmic binding protein/LacI transcriptional regulator [Pseudomonas sp.]